MSLVAQTLVCDFSVHPSAVQRSGNLSNALLARGEILIRSFYENGDQQMVPIRKCHDAHVVSAQIHALVVTSRAGAMRDHGSRRQAGFDAPRGGDRFPHEIENEVRMVLRKS